jgi:hypothetical protein
MENNSEVEVNLENQEIKLKSPIIPFDKGDEYKIYNFEINSSLKQKFIE